MNKKNLLMLVIAVAATYALLNQQHNVGQANTDVVEQHIAQPLLEMAGDQGTGAIDFAFRQQARNVEVEGQGVVVKVLRDDDEGSRHQKFILRLASGMTLLIAHNIDLAPRVKNLGAGDAVTFKGEYEWNEKGGVVHWTHHDPAGSHPAGWLRHGGQTYQ